MAGLVAADVEGHQPGARLTDRGDEDGEVVGIGQSGMRGQLLLRLTTDAYALRDYHGGPHEAWRNRQEDVAWALSKVAWLFRRARILLPPVEVHLTHEGRPMGLP